MTNRINPRVDIAFKKIFGTEENKDLLISLINSIVGKDEQVLDLTLLNPYNPQNFRTDKLSILDIKAQGHDGKKFNIEIQITDEADYDKRALYYWAKLYTEQLKERDEYGALEKVIGIHILNFTSILDSEKYHNAFHITEKETGLHCFKELELHTIELNKFKKTLDEEFGDIGSKIQSALDLWSTFLLRWDVINTTQLIHSLENAPVKKAIHVLNVMNFSEEERELYEGQLKWLRIETNTLKKYEEKGREKGIQEGMEKGMKKGLEKGLEEGAKTKAIKIARTLLEQNFTLSQIAQITGLSEEEVIALKH